MSELSFRALSALPGSVSRPRYDRAHARIGIVHLGLGAFQRAHQAVYTEEVLAGGDLEWGIAGVSLRSPETRDALVPQDGLYTVAVRSGQGDRLQVIGSVLRSLVAPEDPEAVLALLAARDTRIVSLTVTEKGYCHNPATGELDEAHADIRHDLAHPKAPRSAPGFLVEALARRQAAGILPFTVLSCDNLPANGQTARRVVTRLAHLRDEALGAFVEGEVAFPSTMVDRIVPATTDDDRAFVAQALGVRDAWPVMTEPFTQWVIEDRFPTGRPAWERAGASFTSDVEPFELMKLRLLNGSHSTLSYLGYLAGFETVSDVMGAPRFAEFLAAMMREEIAPTLPPLPGFDLGAYQRQLLQRFQNPALRHRTWQIAMDGSQKIPQRLLGTIRHRLAAGAPFERLALGLAGWMRYVAGSRDGGEPIDVRDPLGVRLRALCDEAGPGPKRQAAALLSVREVFGDDLPADPAFREAVTGALAEVMARGAAGAVAARA
ncbi:mannitol dehydrogenase family protein [Aureimonas sp. ME7]|uniref:mannitol dehydrogenase family protein n=1 Tax=Aureimonas sp. ME7 TaxID=2744252 RepID=UPI0015F5C2B2|nr:mannitol dehydrogenase family protein [Aureimonas sp. ME7]